MIIRINEFDPANADAYSGWEVEPLRGPIEYDWPADTHAFEVLVLETNERKEPLAEEFRRTQLRRLIPKVTELLISEGEELVARFDGPMSCSSLVNVLHYCTDPLGRGRFAISDVVQLDPVAPPPLASVRMHLAGPVLEKLIKDAKVPLEDDIRIRLFAVPPSLVNPLIDIDDLTDDRWHQILAGAGFMLSTNWQLTGMHLLTRRYDAGQTQQRLSRLELA